MISTDGIYKISNEEYHADKEYISSSKLKLFPNKIDEYLARYEITKEESEATIMGTAIHTKILEPHLFNRNYCIEPQNLDKRKAKDKEIFKNLTHQALSENKTILTFEQLTIITKIEKSIFNHPIAKNLLSKSHNEQSFFLKDDGIKQKVRPDARKENMIIDLKTIDNVNNFPDNVIKFNYYFSAIMYKKIIESFYGDQMDFLFIVVQKKYPYTCIVRQLSNELKQLGEDQYVKAKEAYKKTQETGEWDLIQEVKPPHWFNIEKTLTI